MLPHIESVRASAYTVPTDQPESDGTLAWDSTTIVVVEARAGAKTGLGYTYTDPSAAALINGKLADVVTGLPAAETGQVWQSVVQTVRNLGRPGLASTALSAIDIAVWDLKARLLELPLTALLPAFRDTVPVYGSGGFTSYCLPTLERQLSGWVADGMTQVKIKVGRDPDQDEARVRAARAAIGEAELFVDANGAWTRKQALQWADTLADCGVTWLEEPVSSDDLDGLRLLRDRGPAGMDITAGSTATTSPTSGACWMRARWTACRPTSPAVAGSPACCPSPPCATRTRSTCPRTPPRASAHTPPPRCGTCGTWSTSTTTSGSSTCCSTGP
jgi:L-alanine-DL-glutamate epimerase-like enolase superfamily enzyme